GVVLRLSTNKQRLLLTPQYVVTHEQFEKATDSVIRVISSSLPTLLLTKIRNVGSI
ncbi:hypothetical protein QBC36DRAFT_151760, partial [Triangularia setosa]